MNKATIAGIVTFNPDINRLKQNIESIIYQVKAVVIVDNNSSNIQDIESLNYSNLIIIRNDSNKGIAFALNQMLEWADKKKYGWVITLDQDSVCPADYISTAQRYMKNQIGQIVPILFESNSKTYQYLGDKPNGKTVQYVSKSITSASITSVEVWKEIGGFDNDLFIDYVDYDYAIRLRLAGYKILRLNNVFLDHQIGNSVIRKIGFISVRVANHSSFRKYYICRNIIVFIRRYRRLSSPLAEVLRLIKVLLFTSIFETEKREKLSSIFNGIKDGLVYDIYKD